MGWAGLLHHPEEGPSCPARPSRRGLVPISRPLKGGFMSVPKCLILCVQNIQHTTCLGAFLWQGASFPTSRAEAEPDATWEVPCQEKERVAVDAPWATVSWR